MAVLTKQPLEGRLGYLQFSANIIDLVVGKVDGPVDELRQPEVVDPDFTGSVGLAAELVVNKELEILFLGSLHIAPPCENYLVQYFYSF